MRLLSVLFVFILVTGGLAGRPRRQVKSACEDYAKRPGRCGSVRECPSLLRLLSKDPSPEDISKLRNSTCGTQDGQILLCCADDQPPKVTTVAPPTDKPFVPPEEHPNRPILDRGSTCGTSPESKIVGGEEAKVGQYPWVALLGYRTISNRRLPVAFECGGTLISTQHVLTAAHCVDKNVLRSADFELASVRLGEHNLESEKDCRQFKDGSEICKSPQDFRIDSVIMHSEYDRGTSANDIALLKLNRPVNEDEFVGKICLPFDEARQRDYTGTNLTVAGFGRTGPNAGSPSSQVLMHVQLPGVSLKECQTIIGRHEGVVTPLQICAGGQQGRDSCPGDSGGPLMVPTPQGPPYSLVGIVSFGAIRCGEGGVPSVNTRVSEYLDWILDRLDD